MNHWLPVEVIMVSTYLHYVTFDTLVLYSDLPYSIPVILSNKIHVTKFGYSPQCYIHLNLVELFCLCKSKLITPSFKLSPFTLCTVHTQDKTNWNWVLLIEGFGLFFLIGKNTLSFWIGSKSYCRAIISASILVIKLNFKCICFVSYSHDFSY